MVSRDTAVLMDGTGDYQINLESELRFKNSSGLKWCWSYQTAVISGILFCLGHVVLTSMMLTLKCPLSSTINNFADGPSAPWAVIIQVALCRQDVQGNFPHCWVCCNCTGTSWPDPWRELEYTWWYAVSSDYVCCISWEIPVTLRWPLWIGKQVVKETSSMSGHSMALCDHRRAFQLQQLW